MSIERHNKGNPKFINLTIGDKVLLISNFKTSNVFAKPTWEPVCVLKTIPTSNGAVRRVTIKKAYRERVTLTISKLAIAEEDLVNRYSKFQGLETIGRQVVNNTDSVGDEERIPANDKEMIPADDKEIPIYDRSTTLSSNVLVEPPMESIIKEEPSDGISPPKPSTRRSRGRPAGSKNKKFEGDPACYSLRSKRGEANSDADNE